MNVQLQKGTSLWQDAYRRILANRLALISLWVFIFVALLCLLGPLFMEHSYEDQTLANASQPPSLDHWMGTDTLGRDLYVRILCGGRISIAVGFVATMVSLLIGVAYGASSAYLGGRIDTTMMRIVDVLYALPFTVFVILLTVIFGRSIIMLFIAIGAVEWLTMARIVRAQVLDVKKQTFVEAAITLGLNKKTIIWRHILPSILGPVVVYSTLTIPAVILLESVLSFLGLGVQPPMSSWGTLIKEGADLMEMYPWMLFFPVIFFSATLLCLNFIGDGIRDVLDPQSSTD